jgi:cell division protein FtsW
MTPAAPASAAPPARRRRFFPWLSVLDRPLASYQLILGCACLLLAIGLIMVLSTSSASLLSDGDSPYGVFIHQLVGALIGLPMMWVLSRLPARSYRAVAYPVLLIAIASLAFVYFFGVDVNGARRWIVVAGTQIQPSEFAKLALLLWGADLLARREQLGQLGDWRKLLLPLLPGASILALLVIMGDDLGTTFVLLLILLALLWVVAPGRLFAAMLGLVFFALFALVIVEEYRNARIAQFFHPSPSPTGQNMQAIQGKTAIGSGGIFGVGFGDSREKWGWVPNASTDFIFAILGEELGLVGTLSVVFLYGGLAYAGLRVARRMTDPFLRLAAAGITVWIVGQALVNICTVIVLLPITGVPLPLISQGLSSLLVTMAAIGILLSCARREPDAVQALSGAWERRLALRFLGSSPLAKAKRASQVPRGRPAAVRPAGPPARPPAGRPRPAGSGSVVRPVRRPAQPPSRPSAPPRQPGPPGRAARGKAAGRPGAVPSD